MDPESISGNTGRQRARAIAPAHEQLYPKWAYWVNGNPVYQACREPAIRRAGRFNTGGIKNLADISFFYLIFDSSERCYMSR